MQEIVGGLVASVVATEGPVLHCDGLRGKRDWNGAPVVANERRRVGALGSGLREQGWRTLPSC